ncbi:glycoside hydrolase domain-containing protein [Sphingobacterium gobiense]|uniref:glycoside hydrolase domain-containing protein n=1 Tax=Sphingobacterium gobiense TaxID=1382456 RepID=UPI001C6131A9|nr:glycoside hydrolase domain-containing protein [Sphingobacterium gobiense]
MFVNVKADPGTQVFKELWGNFLMDFNQFTFSDPAESTYLAWYAMADGFDGFLRWAFNSWVENPLHDSRFRTWPAGDTYKSFYDLLSTFLLAKERLCE